MPCLPIEDFKSSEQTLRRAHVALAWLLHFYAHTIPSTEPIIVPQSLTIPLLQVSSQLRIPPVLTYSDTALYNWRYKEPSNDYDEDSALKRISTIDKIRTHTSFTGSTDEVEFFLASTRIELKGAEALEFMRLSLDEVFVGDDTAIHRITGYLECIAAVILELRDILLRVKQTVDPDVFYNQIRPWIGGFDIAGQRPCVFEGREKVEGWAELLSELFGTSAAQSSLFQAFDVYLGIDAEAPQTSVMLHPPKKSFQERMRAYMPRYHRAFLDHLRGNPGVIREFVRKVSSPERGFCDFPILVAYNAAVKALKEVSDAQMIITTLFVVLPDRRAARVIEEAAKDPLKGQEKDLEKKGGEEEVKGTGGSDLVKFLKGVRDQTAETYLPN